MWVATRPPPGTWPLAVDDQVVAFDLDLDAVDAQHGGGRFQPVGFLDAQFLQAAHDASCLRQRRPRPPAPDIRRSSRARAPAAPRRRAACEARTRRSAPSARRRRRATSLSSMEAPISRSVVNRPVRSGLVITSESITSEPGDDQRRHDRECRRGRIGRHHDLGAVQFGLAGERDPAAMAAFRASRRSRRRNASASVRCGRGWLPARSPW